MGSSVLPRHHLNLWLRFPFRTFSIILKMTTYRQPEYEALIQVKSKEESFSMFLMTVFRRSELRRSGRTRRVWGARGRGRGAPRSGSAPTWRPPPTCWPTASWSASPPCSGGSSAHQPQETAHANYTPAHWILIFMFDSKVVRNWTEGGDNLSQCKIFDVWMNIVGAYICLVLPGSASSHENVGFESIGAGSCWYTK